MAVVENRKNFFEAYQHQAYRKSDRSGTLTAGLNRVRGDTPLITDKLQRAETIDANYGKGPGYRQGVERTMVPACIGNGQADQLQMKQKVGALNCMHDQQAVMDEQYAVRRLTPLECERLQGFPDGWTEGESDSARYKALGNSLALPNALYVMAGIAKYGEEEQPK